MIYTVTVSLFDLSPDCRKHQAIGGVPIPQEFHLSVVRPHCLRRFHARTVTGREYHYLLRGSLPWREPPAVRSFPLQLSAPNLYLMPEYSVVKEQRKYFPLYYTSRKNRPVEHPKSTFWKNIFISAQNSVSISVLYAYILSKHWWKSLSRLGGEERNPRRSRLSSPPYPVVYTPYGSYTQPGCTPSPFSRRRAKREINER